MQLTLLDEPMGTSQPSQFGKTSRVSCPLKTMPSDALLARWLGVSANYSQQGKNGRTLVVCMDQSALLPGAFLTLNTSESPSVAVECLLSQVLEPSTHHKYYLSSAACAGILRRAQVRGKTLPALLQRTLSVVAQAENPTERPLGISTQSSEA